MRFQKGDLAYVTGWKHRSPGPYRVAHVDRQFERYALVDPDSIEDADGNHKRALLGVPEDRMMSEDEWAFVQNVKGLS